MTSPRSSHAACQKVNDSPYGFSSGLMNSPMNYPAAAPIPPESYMAQMTPYGVIQPCPSDLQKLYRPPLAIQATPLVSQASTPGSSAITTPDSASHSNILPSRKRQRRCDHATPGDEGDSFLKDMAYKAMEQPFDEFALSVKSSECTLKGKGPNEATLRERKRQIFGMLCLIRSCEMNEKAVVPRNRIYSRYASICQPHGITPLSAASFGKLVRILFPTIATRRLGMRGQSKYHYCGIKLVGDSGADTPAASPASFYGSPFSTSHSHTNSNSNSVGSPASVKPSLERETPQFDSGNLNFIWEASELNIENELCKIPPIWNMDPALLQHYRNHSLELFQTLRHMQLRKFFSIVSSFAQSLNRDASELLWSNRAIPWILSNDLVVYKCFMRLLSKSVLDEIPANVSKQLHFIASSFSETLLTTLTSRCENQTLLRHRVSLAESFQRLVRRLVRVNMTSDGCGKVLLSDGELMAKNWVDHVDFKELVLREAPCKDPMITSRVYGILSTDVPDLLFSLDKTSTKAIMSCFSKKVMEFVIQFPKVAPRMILLSTSSILTYALREISLAGGQGFGAWWIVRCWVDEWLGFCAELGGFLENEFTVVQSGDLDSSEVNFDLNNISTNVLLEN